MDMKQEIFAFVGIVFLLLGVLFGMQIMTFIFGSLTTNPLPVASITIGNETNAFINGTGYTLNGASDRGFSSVVITLAINGTDLADIGAGNYTVNVTSGLVINATGENWENVSFAYTYNRDSQAQIVSEAVTNNSLVAVETYTDQADTQFNTSAIAITLLVLIALFAIFWRVFMSKDGISGSGSGGGGGSRSKNFSS